MSDSDDDMPPPLEDMSTQIMANQAKKQQSNQTRKPAGGAAAASQAVPEDDGEEIRLVPKAKPGVTRIAPSDGPPAAQPKAPLIQDVTPTPAAAAAKPAPKKSSGLFGGLKRGFLSSGPAKKKPAAAAAKPVVEDYTHVKAAPKDESLRFDEVQNNLKTNLESTKDEWMTPGFMEKIMQSPRLLAAFQDPATMKILTDMGSKPQETMQKYGNNPEFKELLLEFSALCGNHFTDLADKKKEEEEKKMADDPITKIINSDPEVKAILEDPKVMAMIQKLQRGGGLDFNQVVREDPVTGHKMYQLIQKGVLNTQTTPPSGGQLP